MELKEKAQSIGEFYERKSILVTGFTGFIGKMLVEKLLWSCPQVSCIYVIVRQKRDKTAQDRMNDIISLPLFERLRSERPEVFKTKLVALSGDLPKPQMGLSNKDLALLTKNVNIIFHGAASVRFDDTLIEAVDNNTRSTKNIIDFAYTLNSLDCLVHISTAYTNCDRLEIIYDKLYPPHADWKLTFDIIEKFDSELVNTLAVKYLGKMPNTYVFTKSLAEHVVADHSDKLPSLIVRPSIVISSLSEPMPGWVENLNGPIAIIGGYGVGVVRTSLCNPYVEPDYVPADIVVKSIIVAAWSRAHVRYLEQEGSTVVLNMCASDRSLTTADVLKLGGDIEDLYPMKIAIWKPNTHISTSKFWFIINFYFFHLIPAFFIDLLLRIIGKKPMLWKIQRRIYLAMMALAYFTNNSLRFDHSSILLLDKLVPEDERDHFSFNKKNCIDDFKFFANAAIGFQKYLLGQKESDLPAAIFRQKIFIVLDFLVKGSSALCALWLFYSYQVPLKVFNFLSNLILPQGFF